MHRTETLAKNWSVKCPISTPLKARACKGALHLDTISFKVLLPSVHLDMCAGKCNLVKAGSSSSRQVYRSTENIRITVVLILCK